MKRIALTVCLILALCGSVLAMPGNLAAQVVQQDRTLTAMAEAFARLDFQQGISIGLGDSRYVQYQPSFMKAIAHNSGSTPWNSGNTAGISFPSNSSNVLTRQQWNFPAGASVVSCVYSGYVNTGGGSQGGTADTDTPIATAITLQAYVEDSSNGMHQLTFNGQTSWTLNPGAFIKTDPLVIALAPGTKCWVRTYMVGTAGSLPMNCQTMGYSTYTAYPHEGLTGSTSAISPTAAVSDSSSTGFGPQCVIGLPAPGYSCPSVVVAGDSIACSNAPATNINGSYYPDTNLTPGAICATDTCWPQTLIRNRAGAVYMCHSGYTLNELANNRFKSQQMFQYATVAIVELGINDINTGGNGGRTAAQIETDLQTVLTIAKGCGCKLAVCTIGPNNAWSGPGSASPEAFLTFSGDSYTRSLQSVESVRQAYNTYVRTGTNGGALSWTVIDLDGFLCPSNTGLWSQVSPVFQHSSFSVTITGLGSTSSNAPNYGSAFTDSTISVANGAYANPADGYGPYFLIVVSDTVTSGNNGSNGYVWDNLTGGALTVIAGENYLVFPPIATSTSTTLNYIIADLPTYDGIHYTTRTHNKVAAYVDGVLKTAGLFTN